MTEVKFSINDLTLKYDLGEGEETLKFTPKNKIYKYKELMEFIKDEIGQIIGEDFVLKVVN